MAENEKDIRAALAMYHAADTHQKANLAIERWLFATTPKKLEALFAELDHLRQAQAQPVIAPIDCPFPFAIVIDRGFEGEGFSLAVFNGTEYMFTDGDCFHREGDFLDGCPAEFITAHQLEKRLLPAVWPLPVVEKERNAFEHNMRRRHPAMDVEILFHRDKSGRYGLSYVDMEWSGWQDAIANRSAVEPVTAPVAVPLTKEKRREIFVSAWNIYRDSWPDDIETRIAAVCNYSCRATEAAHGITGPKE